MSQAEALLGGDVEAVALLAVDSFVGVDSLTAFRRDATTPWMANLPRPAEAAAAAVVCRPETARREGLEVLATIVDSRCQAGRAHDDNDAVVDGDALTALLGAMPLPQPGLEDRRGAPGGAVSARVRAAFHRERDRLLRRSGWRDAPALRVGGASASGVAEAGSRGRAAHGLGHIPRWHAWDL
jgi:hypothetical protein